MLRARILSSDRKIVLNFSLKSTMHSNDSFSAFTAIERMLPGKIQNLGEGRQHTLALRVSTFALSNLLSTEASLYFWLTSVRRFNKVEFSTLNWDTYIIKTLRSARYSIFAWKLQNDKFTGLYLSLKVR